MSAAHHHHEEGEDQGDFEDSGMDAAGFASHHRDMDAHDRFPGYLSDDDSVIHGRGGEMFDEDYDLGMAYSMVGMQHPSDADTMGFAKKSKAREARSRVPDHSKSRTSAFKAPSGALTVNRVNTADGTVTVINGKLGDTGTSVTKQYKTLRAAEKKAEKEYNKAGLGSLFMLPKATWLKSVKQPHILKKHRSDAANVVTSTYNKNTGQFTNKTVKCKNPAAAVRAVNTMTKSQMRSSSWRPITNKESKGLPNTVRESKGFTHTAMNGHYTAPAMGGHGYAPVDDLESEYSEDGSSSEEEEEDSRLTKAAHDDDMDAASVPSRQMKKRKTPGDDDDEVSARNTRMKKPPLHEDDDGYRKRVKVRDADSVNVPDNMTETVTISLKNVPDDAVERANLLLNTYTNAKLHANETFTPLVVRNQDGSTTPVHETPQKFKDRVKLYSALAVMSAAIKMKSEGKAGSQLSKPDQEQLRAFATQLGETYNTTYLHALQKKEMTMQRSQEVAYLQVEQQSRAFVQDLLDNATMNTNWQLTEMIGIVDMTMRALTKRDTNTAMSGLITRAKTVLRDGLETIETGKIRDLLVEPLVSIVVAGAEEMDDRESAQVTATQQQTSVSDFVTLQTKVLTPYLTVDKLARITDQANSLNRKTSGSQPVSSTFAQSIMDMLSDVFTEFITAFRTGEAQVGSGGYAHMHGHRHMHGQAAHRAPMPAGGRGYMHNQAAHRAPMPAGGRGYMHDKPGRLAPMPAGGRGYMHDQAGHRAAGVGAARPAMRSAGGAARPAIRPPSVGYASSRSGAGEERHGSSQKSMGGEFVRASDCGIVFGKGPNGTTKVIVKGADGKMYTLESSKVSIVEDDQYDTVSAVARMM